MILNDTTFQNSQNEHKNGPKTVLTFLKVSIYAAVTENWKISQKIEKNNIFLIEIVKIAY